MPNRRHVLQAALGAAAGALLHSPAAPAAGMARAGRGFRIDALSGSELFQLPADDPRVPAALQALRASGMTALMAAPAPQGQFWYTDAAFEKNKRDLLAWQGAIARHPEVLQRVESHADLVRARRDGKVGVVFTFQGAEPLGEDPGRIALFRGMGLRVLQLTHNRRNLAGDGCEEPGNAGLSNLGHQFVERLNAERMVVDLSHGSQRTIRDAILASKAPVLIGHTGCRSLVDVPRLVYDAELRLMADRGGVAGIIFWPYLREQGQQTAADVIRHIEHAIDVCGEDHVGIGTDINMTPVDVTPAYRSENREYVEDMIADGIFEPGRDPDLLLFVPDLNVANRFDVLGDMLAARGHSGARVDKILGGNFARVMREVWGG